MAEPPRFALPGLQLAGCSLGPSGAVSVVYPSSRREWEACVRHHFAAIHSLMLSQMLLPSAAGTAERIQPRASVIWCRLSASTQREIGSVNIGL